MKLPPLPLNPTHSLPFPFHTDTESIDESSDSAAGIPSLIFIGIREFIRMVSEKTEC